LEAVRATREATGLSQTDFARKYLEKTLPTQQRYENVVPPPGEVLVVLARVAQEFKRTDLVEILTMAAIETVPEQLRGLILEKGNVKQSSSHAAIKRLHPPPDTTNKRGRVG
jgi:transcriptional regulator with XRE-family HTH domain